ncbi:MarR family winged helix-turn-helix transcriptional regulator [Ciceribacter thiooxidans]|uniref:MarR family winged helix-turn-helix transcriptional regulator n=1 Tax=Ciceribacter thiooxidans TaxID=1969821 RepID=A0ABV7I008_9HYPH|nr:MarR family winged helix-turn-helix transcriptional regulator [Ciceribacter thiooxidans]
MHMHLSVNLDAFASLCYDAVMEKTPSDAAIRAWARLTRAQQTAMGVIEQRLKAAKLPPLAWYDVLLEVERAGPAGLRPFELEKAMLLAQYSLSRLLSRIEEAGYIVRQNCEEDGRGQLITITDAGKTARREIWAVYSAAIEAAVGQHLSDEQANTLSDLLERIVAHRPKKRTPR